MAFSAALLGLVILQVVVAKVFLPCDLAEVLVKKHGFKADSVGNWVCLAKFSSGFNTAAVNGQSDGSFNYGIFQINEKYCRVGSKTSCGFTCSDLQGNDLNPSVQCAMKIFNKQGFSGWPDWKNDCKGKDVSQYVRRCSLKSGHMMAEEISSE